MIEQIDYLSQFITKERHELILSVLKQRTRHIAVVLENLYQSQNASAVLRSCDCFGIQDVHVLVGDNSFRPVRSISQGAAKWLTVKRHSISGGDSIKSVLRDLKNQGYQVVATVPSQQAVSLDAIDVSQKMVLCFGTEETGLSPELVEMADQKLQIPMVGFTQSLNLSVSAGICLQALTTRLRSSSVLWSLTEKEFLELQRDWMVASTPRGKQILKQFLSEGV